MARWASAALDAMSGGTGITQKTAPATMQAASSVPLATTFAKPSTAITSTFSKGYSPSVGLSSSMTRRPDPTFTSPSSLMGSRAVGFSSGFTKPSSLIGGLSSSMSGFGVNKPSTLLGGSSSYGNGTKPSAILGGGTQQFQKPSSLLAPPAMSQAQDMGAAANASLSNAGGQWAIADGLNGAIAAGVAQVKAETGLDVPANLVKAMLYREGGGKGLKDEAYLRGEKVYGFNGIFQSTARSWGIDYDRMLTDDNYAVYAMAKGLAQIANYQYGGKQTLAGWGWEGVASTYFGGAPVAGFVDELGNVSGGGGPNDYVNGPNGVVTQWKQLDAMDGGGLSTWPTTGGGAVTVSGKASTVIAKAQEFLGTPYVWGGVNPKSGWDCSGMTWWLDQNYGTGQLPQGSHQQMAYAQQTGQFFQDQGQLQAGDLLFFDTGDDYASGMNRASHVGMYLGNGQFINAANESVGTVIYNLSSFGGYLGAMHQSWSGGSAAGNAAYNVGAAAVAGLGGGSTATYSSGGTPYQNQMNRLLGILYGG